MIGVLLAASLIGWSYWLMVRNAQKPCALTPTAAPARRANNTATSLGLEDDADQWPDARGAWTALDDCQLTRLLAESALDHDDTP